MSELRWTLLILGVVFLAALSWWERRRPRQAFAPRLREAGPPHGELPNGDAHRTASADRAVAGEPWIGEAGLSDVVSSDVSLPAVAQDSGPGPLRELPTLVIPEAALIDPMDVETPTAAVGTEPGADRGPEPLDSEIPGAEGVGAVRIVEPFPGEAAPRPEPIVEWPPEESRRILALRLVAPPGARFPGRTLRLALAAEGFVLGKFAIFHKPDEANRAVISAASLTRPGAFDLESMDSQRYGGLSLFAVLPGPKAPVQAFDELLATARNLNERLQGALQDERGGPLTPLRVTAIREGLRAEAAALPAAAAHGG